MKVLVVIDCQNDFIDGTLPAFKAVSMIEYLKNKIKNFKQEVVYTMDTHDENYLNTTEGKNLPVKHCIKNTYGWKLREGIYKENCKIFEKNSFGCIELVKYLEKLYNQKKLESVEFTGICTDICVITNVLLTKAHLPELEIIVDSKACSAVTEKTQLEAIDIMKMLSLIHI